MSSKHQAHGCSLVKRGLIKIEKASLETVMMTSLSPCEYTFLPGESLGKELLFLYTVVIIIWVTVTSSATNNHKQNSIFRRYLLLAVLLE
jgi:hypothetical protein